MVLSPLVLLRITILSATTHIFPQHLPFFGVPDDVAFGFAAINLGTIAALRYQTSEAKVQPLIRLDSFGMGISPGNSQIHFSLWKMIYVYRSICENYFNCGRTEFQGTQTLIPVDHILAASSHGVWSSFRP